MAGYSGGRKVISPGIAGEKTIRSFHHSKFMVRPVSCRRDAVHSPGLQPWPTALLRCSLTWFGCSLLQSHPLATQCNLVGNPLHETQLEVRLATRSRTRPAGCNGVDNTAAPWAGGQVLPRRWDQGPDLRLECPQLFPPPPFHTRRHPTAVPLHHIILAMHDLSGL